METGNPENTTTYTVEISQNYFIQLKQIVWHIALEKQQPLNALKVSLGIEEKLNKIITNPLIFSTCENLPTKSNLYREARYKSWLIVFKLQNNTITILGVLSGKQRPTSFKKIRKFL